MTAKPPVVLLLMRAYSPDGRLRSVGPPTGVRIIPSADFIALEASARLVLTESGGVQEQTVVLGVPCLTLRDNTEQPITLAEGTNRLVGRTQTGSSRRHARCWPHRRLHRAGQPCGTAGSGGGSRPP